MCIIINFPALHRKPGLDGIIAEIVWRVHSAPGQDSLAAQHRAEQIYVAGSYAHWFFAHVLVRSVQEVGYPDLAAIDPFTVAEHVAPDLDRDGQAGIARTVRYLVAHAQKHIQEPAAA
jgi:hypothetical protein